MILTNLQTQILVWGMFAFAFISLGVLLHLMHEQRRLTKRMDAARSSYLTTPPPGGPREVRFWTDFDVPRAWLLLANDNYLDYQVWAWSESRRFEALPWELV